MVWIPGGTFRMGTTEEHPHFRDAPEHEVEVAGFWLDETEVTNAQFAAFVEATKYVTVAEQKPTLESIRAGLPPGSPDPPAEVLVPGSLVFTQPSAPRARSRMTQGTLQVDWSRRVLETPRGAGQRHQGPDESPGRPRLLEGRGGLREMGRQAAADRGRVGVRRARRAGRQEVRVGR